MIIDAHQHFWSTARTDYGWMTPDVPVLYRDYGPADLAPLLQAAGIDRTILVQAAETDAETDYLLDLAARSELVAGVVGWLDLESPDFEARLEIRLVHPKFVGVRPMLQDLPDDAYIVRPRVIESLRVLAARNVPFDFLTFPRHLPYVLEALQHVPGLRAVIDHLSKPDIRSQTISPWRELITEVAAFPNVFCKISGMFTEADHDRWSADDVRPFVHHAITAFGPERLMFGSDWPVSLQAADYGRVFETTKLIAGERLQPEQLAHVFGSTAQKFYKLR